MNMAREQWVGRFAVAENDYSTVFSFFSVLPVSPYLLLNR